jgi:ABC-type phosphate transport system substrate-binding protein
MTSSIAPHRSILTKPIPILTYPFRRRRLIYAFWLASLFCGGSHAEVIRTALNDSGVVVLTNAEVQAGDLSLANLRAIFTIRKRSWDDKTPIKVFVLPDQNPLHQKFCKTILKVYPYVLREQWDRLIFSGTGIPPTIVKNEQELQAIINATPGAIGYAPLSSTSDVATISGQSKNLFVLRTSSEY